MRVPNYPSNREADGRTGAKAPATANRREGVRKDEAKSGDLFAPDMLLGLGYAVCFAKPSLEAEQDGLPSRLFI